MGQGLASNPGGPAGNLSSGTSELVGGQGYPAGEPPLEKYWQEYAETEPITRLEELLKNWHELGAPRARELYRRCTAGAGSLGRPRAVAVSPQAVSNLVGEFFWSNGLPRPRLDGEEWVRLWQEQGYGAHDEVDAVRASGFLQFFCRHLLNRARIAAGLGNVSHVVAVDCGPNKTGLVVHESTHKDTVWRLFDSLDADKDGYLRWRPCEIKVFIHGVFENMGEHLPPFSDEEWQTVIHKPIGDRLLLPRAECEDLASRLLIRPPQRLPAARPPPSSAVIMHYPARMSVPTGTVQTLAYPGRMTMVATMGSQAASPVQSARSLTPPRTQLTLSAPPVYAPPVYAPPVYTVQATASRPSTPRGRQSEPVVTTHAMEQALVPVLAAPPPAASGCRRTPSFSPPCQSVPATEPLTLSARSQPLWQSLRAPVKTVPTAQLRAASPAATRAVSPVTLRVAAVSEPVTAPTSTNQWLIGQGGIFELELQTRGGPLGVTVDHSLAILAIADGPLKEHNARQPHHAVLIGDRFVAINGRDVSTQQEYFSAISGQPMLHVTLARGVQADVLSLSRASRASSVATLPPDMIGLAGEFWRIFREVDVDKDGALQWNTSEIRSFVVKIFEHLGLPHPTFADHLWYQWFIEVDRNRNGRLEFAEAVEFARYVLQQAVRLKGGLPAQGPARAQQPGSNNELSLSRGSSPPATVRTIVVSPGQTTPRLPVVAAWLKPQTWTQLPAPHVQAPESKLNIDGAAQPVLHAEPVAVMRPPSGAGSITA